MKISQSKKAISILESLQIQAENEYVTERVPKLDDKKLLDQLRRNVAEGMGIDEQTSKSELNNAVESYLDLLRSSQDNLPTKYEDPVFFTALMFLFPVVIDAANDLGYKLPESVSLGTVCSGKVNAHIIPVDEKNAEYLLVYNRQIFRFCDLFSRFIASLIISDFENRQYLKERKPIESEIAQLSKIIYYLINKTDFFRNKVGSIDLVISLDKQMEPPITELNDASRAFKELLYVSMNASVIAHELSHLVLRKQEHDTGEKGNSNDEKSKFHEEVACDTIGCRIAAQTVSRLCKNSYAHGWQKIGIVGNLFFLSCLNITQKAAFIMQNGCDLPKIMEEVDLKSFENNIQFSHPTTLFRMDIVKAVLFNELKKTKSPNATDWIFEYCDWIEIFFHKCWEELRKTFFRHYENRKRMLEHAQKYYHKGIKNE